MVFYNGFNLLLDIVFCYVAYKIGKSFGKSEAQREYEEEN